MLREVKTSPACNMDVIPAGCLLSVHEIILAGPPTTRVSREEIKAEYERACREATGALYSAVMEDDHG